VRLAALYAVASIIAALGVAYFGKAMALAII
jgi:hypothetical protein